MLFVVIITALGSILYLISSSSFQTKLVFNVTKDINRLIDGKIEIGSFLLSPSGFIKANDVIILDHHSDTLFYSKQIESWIKNTEDFYKKKFSFSNSKIEDFYINIIQYENEQENSLNTFINDIKSGSYPQKGIRGTIKQLEEWKENI